VSKRLLSLPVLAVVAAVLVAALGGGSSSGAGLPVDVFPYEGTPTAMPTTQVSFRGAPIAAITGVQVSGSQSGPHSGTMKAHSDGNGASFVPDKPFTEGEQVTVSAGVPLTGAVGGKVTFTIAKLLHPAPPDPPPAVDPAGHPSQEQKFRSRTDLRPPRLKILKTSAKAAPGYTFFGPKAGPGQDGNEIVDSHGRTVFFHRVPDTTSGFDFRTQTYQGKPVLTWWQGVVGFGKGYGFGLIYDQAYRRIARVAAGNGYKVDLHEFLITPRNTALINVYQPVQFNLGPGAKSDRAFDSILQEVDIKTGLVLYEWHSLGQIAFNESFVPVAAVKPGAVYDYVHINSAQPLLNGNLFISGRNTGALYELDRHTGAIKRRIGGKKSGYAMGAGTSFLGQHDARTLANGDISMFDNGFVAPPPAPSHESRGLVLHLDDAAKTASLVHSFTHPSPAIHAQSQGSNQPLPNGNSLVGWGGAFPYATEYDPSGNVVWEGQYQPAGDDSYRAYRLPWRGQPSIPPAVFAQRTKKKTIVYVSWNGATEVAKWQVLAGNSRKSLKVVRRSRWKGFETRIGAGKAPHYVQVQALDSSGKVLGTSKVRKPKRA
jgi:hypothetical protein